MRRRSVLRVATLEEVAQYGNTLPKGLLPPMGGGAGWSVVGSPTSVSITGTPGTTGCVTSSFSFSAGNILVAASNCFESSTGHLFTFSDSLGNSWTKQQTTQQASIGGYQAVAFAPITTGGTGTGKVTIDVATSVTMELYVGQFAPPAGTLAFDGSLVLSNASTTTVNVQANGTGSNDLLCCVVSDNTFSSWNGGWVAMGGGQQNDAAGYLLNAAGNSSANATVTVSWAASILAIQASTPSAILTENLTTPMRARYR